MPKPRSEQGASRSTTAEPADAAGLFHEGLQPTSGALISSKAIVRPGAAGGLLATVGGHAVTVATPPAGLFLAELAEGSRPSVRSSLRTLLRLMGSPDIDPVEFPWWQLRSEHTRALRAKVEQEFGPAQAKKLLSALRGVLKTAARTRVDTPSGRLPLMPAADLNEALDFKPIRADASPTGRMLSKEEREALRAAAASNPRDAALIAIALSAALRRFELAKLDLANYDPTKPALSFRGKRDKHRFNPIPQSTKDAIEAWLDVRGREPGPLLQGFVNGKLSGKHLSVEGVNSIIGAIRERAGVAAFTPHDLRRTVISQLWEMGVDPAMVQKIAGHANISTSIVYDKRDEKKMQDIVDRMEGAETLETTTAELVEHVYRASVVAWAASGNVQAASAWEARAKELLEKLRGS